MTYQSHGRTSSYKASLLVLIACCCCCVWSSSAETLPPRRRATFASSKLPGCTDAKPIANNYPLPTVNSGLELPAGEAVMSISWVGNSSVMLLLTNATHLYRSTNFGQSFSLSQTNISAVYVEQVKDFVVLVDSVHRMLRYSRDAGESYVVNAWPGNSFPSSLQFHPSLSEQLLLQNSAGPLYFSEDFGGHWRVIVSGLVTYYTWGMIDIEQFGVHSDYDAADTLFARSCVNSVCTAVKLSTQLTHQPITRMASCEWYMVINNFELAMFQNQLYVSRNRGPSMQPATIPTTTTVLTNSTFRLLDATENEVIVAVAEVNDGITYEALFISDSTGLRFSKCLESLEERIDFAKINAFAGAYLVNALRGNGEAKTMITFNKGSIWHALDTSDGSLNPLQLHNQLSRENSLAHGILSSQSAVGLVLATGNPGSAIDPLAGSLYITADAGSSWHESLCGFYDYAILDHGSVLVAIAIGDVEQGVLKYCLDGQGFYWYDFVFYNHTGFEHEQLLVEPGEETVVVTVVGRVGSVSVVYQFDFSATLGAPCSDAQYETVPIDRNTLHNGGLWTGCILGMNQTFIRKKFDEVCYNGRNLDTPITSTPCLCTRQDFECDFGYEPFDNSAEPLICGLDTAYVLQHPLVYPCANDFQTIPSGYRLISADNCTMTSSASKYLPIKQPCSSLDPPASGSHLAAVGIIFGLILLITAALFALHFRKKYKKLRLKYAKLSINGDLTTVADDDSDLDLDVAPLRMQTLKDLEQESQLKQTAPQRLQFQTSNFDEFDDEDDLEHI